MTSAARDLLEEIESWPKEDQDELVEIAREIKARRTGTYVMTDEERAAVREGLEQARRGEFVSDEEMEAFWKRHGVCEFASAGARKETSKKYTGIWSTKAHSEHKTYSVPSGKRPNSSVETLMRRRKRTIPRSE